MSCDVGFTACGTTSSYRRSLGAYECVDTQTDLESCTSMFYSPARYASYPNFHARPQVEVVTFLSTKTPRTVRIVPLFQALQMYLAITVLAGSPSACPVIPSPPTRAHVTVKTGSGLSRNSLRIHTRWPLISFDFLCLSHLHATDPTDLCIVP